MAARSDRELESPAARPAPHDDAALVGRVARGDVAAFETLFRRYVPRLTRFLERNTRRSHLIDEILNDTMLVVWRKAGTFDRCSKVSTWIIGIALRRRLKALERAGDDAPMVDPDRSPVRPRSAPRTGCSSRTCAGGSRGRSTRCRREHRTVIQLTYFEGCSYREIAAITGCPVDTVKTRMFHARRRLKALLDERGKAVA